MIKWDTQNVTVMFRIGIFFINFFHSWSFNECLYFSLGIRFSVMSFVEKALNTAK